MTSMFRGMRAVVSAAIVVQLVAVPLGARAADPQCFASSTEGQKLALAGKLVAAREPLKTCAASSCPKEIADDCADRLAKIEADLPSIVVSAKDAAGAKVTITRVTIDGAEVAANDQPIVLDPGGHDVHVETASAPPIDKHVELAKGAKSVAVDLVVAPAASTEPPPPPPNDVSPPPAPHKSIPTASWIVGGVGVVGLACFAGFGIAALHQSSDLHSSAPGTYTTDDVDALKRKRLLADVSLGVGVVALAAATVIWFTQPAPERKDATAVDVRVVAGGAVAMWGGSF